MKVDYEQLIFDGNVIVELKRDFISGTITCSYTNNSMKTNIIVKEIGDKYISLEIEDAESVPLGTVLNISYQVKPDHTKLTEFERIKVLEKKVEDQEKVLKQVLETLKYRVDIRTFNTWLKALEKQLGVDIVSQSFSTSIR